MVFTLVKLNDAFMIAKLNTLRPSIVENDNASAIADHVKTIGQNVKWDHFDIFVKGKTDYRCKIKETLFIQELEQRRKWKADALLIYSSFHSSLLGICLI